MVFIFIIKYDSIFLIGPAAFISSPYFFIKPPFILVLTKIEAKKPSLLKCFVFNQENILYNYVGDKNGFTNKME